MNKSLFCTLIVTTIVGCFISLPTLSQAQKTTETRNVILIIGDGMDDQQITMARNYLKGAQGQLLLDTLPVRSSVQVLTVAEESPEQAVYVADSANSATAMATGTMTSRGRIATSAKTDKDISTIAEQAKQQGFSVGIVTTASVTDATPASFISHVNQRTCENPMMMVEAELRGSAISDCSNDLIAQGGLGSIAEQIANSPYDVIMGGGLEHFETSNEQGSQSILKSAQANQFHVVQTAVELTELPDDKKVLGLFASKHLPVKWQGENGRIAEQPEPSLLNKIDWRIGDVTLPEPMKCEPNPEYGDTPSMVQMTNAALASLNNNSKGFFLIIESASIDKQSHARNPCGSIGELDQLEATVQAALSFAETQTNTLVMITADHGQAAQIIPDKSLFAAVGVPIYTPGHVARIITPEGSIMAVNYATNDFPYEEHTGVNVPLFANKVGQDFIPRMIKQTDIYHLMAAYLGIE